MVPRAPVSMLSRWCASALAAVVGTLLAAAAPAAEAASLELPPGVQTTEDGVPIAHLSDMAPSQRRHALELGRDMVRAVRAGELERARDLRREFLALDPEVLEDVPWPPVIHAIGATEITPQIDTLELWTGDLPRDQTFVLVFWQPRRGDKRALLSMLAAESLRGGNPVLGVVPNPTARDQQLARELARQTPGLAVGQVTGAAATAWQAGLSQDCLYIEDGEVRERRSCRSLWSGPAVDGAPRVR